MVIFTYQQLEILECITAYPKSCSQRLFLSRPLNPPSLKLNTEKLDLVTLIYYQVFSYSL